MATDKRARKKEHRDAVVAQRQALLRRRRAARLGAVLTVIALIVGAALITAGGDDDEGGGNEAGSQPEPTAAPVESTEPTEAPAGGVACGGEAPPPPSSKQYEAAEQVLEDGVDYRAVIETSCGTIEMDLLEEEAPVTVNNFVFLAQEGFYEGVTFHRVEPTFVIQGGDPQGTGAGGPGYEFEDELWAPSKKYVYGTVAMANAGPNTNGSQFFVIVHEPRKQQAGLAPAYTVFGEVTPASYETLEKIKKVETNGSTPVTPVYMESVEIVEA